jgi:hypothetical protein
MNIEQNAAANQEIKAPGLPEGMSIKVESLKSVGSGEMEQAMASMAPAMATSKIVTDMAMNMDQGGGPQKMTQKITIEVKLQPGDAAEKSAEKAPEAPAAK